MNRHPLLIAALAALLLAASPSAAEESRGSPITGAELAQRIEAGSPPLVLDVRTREEYASGHIAGALNIPHDELASRLGELDIETSDEVVVHCKSGGRAGVAEATLREAGYTNVRDLSGHWKGWQAAGLPSE